MRKDLKRVCKLYQEKEGNKVNLEDCPVGLFVYKGRLYVKTGYYNDGVPECYRVETGERMWVNVAYKDSYGMLSVTPIIVGYGLKRSFKGELEDAVEETEKDEPEVLGPQVETMA